ncbi:hypothetical protein CDD82_908 [Ophiocordyceps australis]|uniref:Uncharacterized protein n=1 Tax=Ophiocordyceps australis TaxID=1399860 RepID=A0A2C5ZPY3_9HYPO|nr:hypothetical protein CDD82_908 [Ophiocordyceps australis]
MVNTHTAYNIAAGALVLVTAVAAAVVFLCSLCLVRRRKDPARSWLVYYKIAFGLFVFAIVLYFFHYLLVVLFDQLYHSDENKDRITTVVLNLRRAGAETGIVGALATDLVVIFALLALLGLGVGINTVYNNGQKLSLDRWLQLAGLAVAVLLGSLDLAVFALREKEFSGAYTDQDHISGDLETLNTDYKWAGGTKAITIAILSIQFACALAVSVNSIVVAVQTRLEPRIKTAVRHLLVCCVLLLLRTSYDLGYFLKYVPLHDKHRGDSKSSESNVCFAVVDIVLSFWPTYILFVVLFALGTKQQHGIWATPGHFSRVGPGDNSPLTPWGYSSSHQSQQSQEPLQSQWNHSRQTSSQQTRDLEREQTRDPVPDQARSPAPSYSPCQVPLPPPAMVQVPSLQSVPSLPSMAPLQSVAPLQAMQPQLDGSSMQPWPAVPAPYFQYPQPYEVSVASGPPPAHFEAMGLYHQADGTPPSSSPLPYDEKR